MSQTPNPKNPKTPKGNNPKGFKQPNRTNMVTIVVFIIIGIFFVFMMARTMTSATGVTQTDELQTSEFMQAVDQGRVSTAVYDTGSYTITGSYYPAATAGGASADAFNEAFDALNSELGTMTNGSARLNIVKTQQLAVANLGSEHNYTVTWVGQDSLGQLMAAHPEIQYSVRLASPWGSILASILPILIIAGLLLFFFSQMNKANNSQMSFGKAKSKDYVEEHPDVKFSDVAGVDEAVEEMQEIKDFLENPAKYQSLGAKIPRGCLLVGPPGTGKTLLARAVAGEAGVPFFSISGSDFVEMFVGVGASRVRNLFKKAKEAAPSIIFIDEIDAVGRQRGRTRVCTRFLTGRDVDRRNDHVLRRVGQPHLLHDFGVLPYPAHVRGGRFQRLLEHTAACHRPPHRNDPGHCCVLSAACSGGRPLGTIGIKRYAVGQPCLRTGIRMAIPGVRGARSCDRMGAESPRRLQKRGGGRCRVDCRLCAECVCGMHMAGAVRAAHFAGLAQADECGQLCVVVRIGRFAWLGCAA